MANATELSSMVTHLDGCLPKKSYGPLSTQFCKVVWQNKTINLHYHMAIKLGKMVTYLEGLLTIKSYNTLITWSCKVTWQTKTIVPLYLPGRTCPLYLTGWKLTLTDSYPSSHMAFWSLGLARSLENTWDHVVTKPGKMVTALRGPNHKFIQNSDHVFLQGRVTNKNHYARVFMASNLGRIITYLNVLLPIKSHVPLIAWSCEITWQTKTIITPLPQWHDHQAW